MEPCSGWHLRVGLQYTFHFLVLSRYTRFSVFFCQTDDFYTMSCQQTLYNTFSPSSWYVWDTELSFLSFSSPLFSHSSIHPFFQLAICLSTNPSIDPHLLPVSSNRRKRQKCTKTRRIHYYRETQNRHLFITSRSSGGGGEEITGSSSHT